MLDMQRLRESPEVVKQASANKNDPVDVDFILELDAQRRSIIGRAEKLKNERNNASRKIALLKREKKDASAVIAEMKGIADTIKTFDSELRDKEEQIREHMARVPNVPHESVPHGESEADNKVVSEWGKKPSLDFQPADHITLSTALDIFDFPRGAKVAGAGFPVYKGAGALLDRALVNYMLDVHTANGYREISPPFLVNSASAFGTGQLPKTHDQMYYVSEDEFYAIPTAEVPVTNLHRDEVLDEVQLPVKYCAYSACFRREAGSYGKDTKGFLRVHQFNKVELVKFTAPDESYEELELLRADAESIMESLDLHYRVLELCDADLSFAAAKCYDLEVWAPGEGRFLEVSSCSNYEDFQARRMNVRYRLASGGRLEFVHTLNGSGLATARLLVAIMETYQQSDGGIRVPEVLQPYMKGMTEIRAR